jgi:hypothetical protein
MRANVRCSVNRAPSPTTRKRRRSRCEKLADARAAVRRYGAVVTVEAVAESVEQRERA